jgi:hypothetical protein
MAGIAVKRARKKSLKPRNPVARSPLMKKGGAHGKTSAARRRQAAVETQKLARDAEDEA